MGADREILIKFRTQGDPSGAAAVTGAMDATAEASGRATERIVQDQRRQKEAMDAAAAAARNAAAVRDSASNGSGGGRTWNIPPTNYTPPPHAGGPDPAGAPPAPPGTPAFEPAPPGLGGGGGGGGALPDLTQGARDAGKAAGELSAELDKAAEASGKIKPDGAEALKDGLDKAGGAAQGAATIVTGLDSLTDELDQLGEKAGELFGKTSGGKQAADLKATAEAAGKAGEAEAAAGEAAAQGAQKQEKAQSALSEHIKKVTAALKEKQEAAAAAAGEAGSAGEEEEKTQEDGAEAYSESVQKVLDALKAKKKASEEAGDADKKAAKGTHEAAEETGKFGQKAMTLAQFFDDLQYGLMGIMNNIPQLLGALGFGAGVAGVVSILAVAVAQLVKHFKIFGEEAPEAAKRTVEEIHKVTTELAKSRNEAKEAAEDWNKSFANGKKHEDDLENIRKKYKALGDEIKVAADAQKRLTIAILEQSNAEMALDLSEIELQRAQGKITDIDAARKSHQVRQDYAKAQFDLAQGQRRSEQETLRDRLGKMGNEYGDNARKYGELSSISKGLLYEKDWEQLQKDREVATSQAEEARKKREETPPTFALPPTWDTSGVRVQQDAANPAYAIAERNEKNAQEYARKMVDRYNEVKQAREDAGKGFEDLARMEERLKGIRDRQAEIEEASKEAGASLTESLKVSEREETKFKTSTRVERNQAQIQITELEKQQTQEAERRAEKELTEKRRKEKEASDKHFDELERQEKAEQQQRGRRTRRRGGAATAEDSGPTVAEQRKQAADAREERWRQEDQQRQEARDEEERLRLDPPDPQTPDDKPEDWKGPLRPGFPGGPVKSPAPEGEDWQRRNRMSGLDNMPDAPSARPVIKRARQQPPPAAGGGLDEEVEGLTTGLDRFIGGKRRAGDRLGGGDARLNELQKATDALKDGATADEVRRMTAAVANLGDTFLAARASDRALLKAATAKLDAITNQIKAGRR